LSAYKNINLQKVVVAVALLLFAVKITSYLLTQSVAIFSDAMESIVNIVTAFIGWYSLYISAQPRDLNHPYGHGKIEFIAATIEGTLIIVAGGFIITQSVWSLWNGNELQSLNEGIVLVLFTAVVNLILGYYCIKTGKATHSLALEASGRHLHVDTLSTLGIVVGLVVINYTGWYFLDNLIAVVVGVYVILMGWRIVRNAIAGIMDEADEELLEQLLHSLNENREENWIDIHNTRIIKYGTILHIDCHLTLPWFFNLNETNKEIDKLQNAFQQTFGDRIELFVHTDGCADFSCEICSKKNCAVRKNDFLKKIDWSVENIRINKEHRSDIV
jgi:cation diffusion facilitator family transporter